MERDENPPDKVWTIERLSIQKQQENGVQKPLKRGVTEKPEE